MPSHCHAGHWIALVIISASCIISQRHMIQVASLSPDITTSCAYTITKQSAVDDSHSLLLGRHISQVLAGSSNRSA